MRKRSLLAPLFLLFSLLLAAPAAYAATTMQIGTAGNDSNNPSSFGAASKMTQPALSASNSTNTWRYYWIGITYPDGTFYQLGYADPSSNSTCSGLMNFVTVFQGSYYNTNTGQCGLTGTRTFGMVIASAGDSTLWAAQMDNQELYGNRIYAPSYFKGNEAIVVSEISSTNQISASEPIPNVTYSPAAHIKAANGSWGPQAHGKVYRGYNGTSCPVYYITGLGGSAVQVRSASSGSCLGSGASLW